MPKIVNLHKVASRIAKKKGGKQRPLHENSRDAHRLRRAVERNDRLHARSESGNPKQRPYLERVDFVQDLVSASTSASDKPTHAPAEKEEEEARLWTTEEMAAMISSYVHRLDPEIEAEKQSRRQGRTSSKRESDLIRQREVEVKEHRAGYWWPDLGDGETVERVRNWTGEWAALATMRFVRITESGERRESAFPPDKGGAL